MSAVFIDTFYDKENQKENQKFEEYTNQLITFAKSTKYFECKDIEIARTQLDEAYQRINNLTGQITQLKQRPNLTNPENSQKRTAGWGNGFIAVIGIICFVFGLLISTVYTKYRQHKGR